jgi:hypothetical protein
LEKKKRVFPTSLKCAKKNIFSKETCQNKYDKQKHTASWYYKTHNKSLPGSTNTKNSRSLPEFGNEAFLFQTTNSNKWVKTKEREERNEPSQY